MPTNSRCAKMRTVFYLIRYQGKKKEKYPIRITHILNVIRFGFPIRFSTVGCNILHQSIIALYQGTYKT